MARESGKKVLRQAAEKYSSFEFENDEQRYRAIGDIAKRLGVTEGDLVKSRAKSIFGKIVNSISDTDNIIDKISSGIEFEREAARKRGDTATLVALDYLERLIESEGSVISVSEMFAANEYTAENRNTAVEVYGKRMETAFKSLGLDISVSVYYDSSENAPRGEWSKDEKGRFVIRLNGSKLQGEQSAFWVLSHELFHEAEAKSAGITQRVLDVFAEMGMYSEEQFEAYKERYKSAYEKKYKGRLDSGEITQEEYDRLVRDYVNEEIAADLMCETMGSTQLLEMFAGKLSDGDRNVILSFFKRMLGGIKKVFNSKDTLPNKFEGIVTEFEKTVKNDVDNASDKGYNGVTKYAVLPRPNDGVEWARGLLNDEEIEQFYSNIADLKKLKFNFPKAGDGSYIFETDKSLILTDGKWVKPTIRYVFTLNNKKYISNIKEYLNDWIKETTEPNAFGRLCEETNGIVNLIYGDESSSFGAIESVEKTYAEQNRRTKGTDSRKTNSGTSGNGKNQVNKKFALSGNGLDSEADSEYNKNTLDSVSYEKRYSELSPEEHNLYDAAKKGDTASAFKLVDSLTKSGKASSVDFSKLDKDVYLLPIVGAEGTSKNILPTYIAEYLSDHYGLRMFYGIYKSAESNSRNQGVWDRMKEIYPSFELGNDSNISTINGKKFIFIDDNSTTGRTFNGLKNFIEENGGTVAGYYALTVGQDASEKMTANESTWNEATEIGLDKLKQFAKEEGIKREISRQGLTERECQELINRWKKRRLSLSDTRRRAENDRRSPDERQGVPSISEGDGEAGALQETSRLERSESISPENKDIRYSLTDTGVYSLEDAKSLPEISENKAVLSDTARKKATSGTGFESLTRSIDDTIYSNNSLTNEGENYYGEKESEGSSSDAVSKRRFSRSSEGGNTQLGKGTRRFTESARKHSERTQYAAKLRKQGKLKTGQVIEDIVCDVVHEEHYSKDMRSVAKTNADRGIHRTVFVSGELKVEDVPGEVFYADGAYIEDENGIITVIIQCDNYHHTPKQINDHEYIHKNFSTSLVQKAKDAILHSLSARERAVAFEVTARNLKGLSKITPTLIQEELTANVLSGMDYVRFGNQFDELRVAFWNGDVAFIEKFDKRVFGRKYNIDSILLKQSDIPKPLKPGDIFPAGSGAEASAISLMWANNDDVEYGTFKTVSHRG